MTSQTKQCTTVQKSEFEQPCVLCLFFITQNLSLQFRIFLFRGHEINLSTVLTKN